MTRSATLALVMVIAACGDTADDADMGTVARDTALAGDTVARPDSPAAASPGGPSEQAGAPADREDRARTDRAYEEIRADACETIFNSFRCARTIEDDVIAGVDRVRRSGDTLRLALASGDTATLVDRSTGDHSDRVYYSYQGYWPDHDLFLLQRQYYEGSAFLLVDDSTGDRTALPDWPLLSPDGRRFAVLSLDLVAGYGPNTLQIWDFEGGRPTRQWETRPQQWGPESGRWLAPDTLLFTQRGYCGEIGGQGRDMCEREVILVRRGAGSWDLVVSAPRAGTPAPRPRRSRRRRRRTRTWDPR